MDHKPGDVFSPGDSANQPASPPPQPGPAPNASLAPPAESPPTQPVNYQSPPTNPVQTDAPLATPPAPTAPGPIPGPSGQNTSVYAPPQKPKRKGLKAAVIALVSVLLIGGAGAYAYLGVYLPNTPENMVKSAFAGLLTSESGKVRAEVDLQSGPISVTPIVEFEAGSERMSANISFKDWAEGVKLEFRGIDDESYIKVDGLSGLFETDDLPLDPFSAAILGSFSAFEGQWIKLDSNDFLSDDTSEITVQDIQALADRELFTITETLADEDIEGRSAKHFKVEFNAEEIKSVVAELDASLDDQIKETLTSLADATAGRQIDIWVYKDTKELAQFLFDTEVDGTSVSGKVTFLSFNQPVEVSAPEGAKTFEEITAELEADFFEDTLPLEGSSGFELEFDTSDFSEFESI